MNYSYKYKGHQKFINQYMSQKNKKEVINKPELFGNITTDKYKQIVFNKNKNKKSVHFKWIISPEKQLTEELLKLHTFNFVTKLEQLTGHKFNWQAAIHQDTPHNHVHLLINGTDINGNDFKFSRNMIQNHAREINQELLTQMCGERDESLLNAAKFNRITSERLTEYDKYILKYIEQIDDKKYIGKIKVEEGDIKRRLEFIRELKLADYKQGFYFLKKEYSDTLTILSRYNMFLDAKKYINPNCNYSIYTSDMGELQGEVKYIYEMNDENVWSNAIVLENDYQNKAYFIPIFKPINKNLLHKNITIFEKSKTITKSDSSGSSSQRTKKIDPVITVKNNEKNINKDITDSLENNYE